LIAAAQVSAIRNFPRSGVNSATWTYLVTCCQITHQTHQCVKATWGRWNLARRSDMPTLLTQIGPQALDDPQSHLIAYRINGLWTF
jgi:hypothetical protein